MTVWIELKNGTKERHTNVDRIVERSGNLEIRRGAGAAEKTLKVYKRTEIRNLGNSTILPRPPFKRLFE